MSDQRTPDEIRSEIEETREELADTAAALAYKADVKARADDRKEEIKADVRSKVDDVKAKVTGHVETVKANPIPAAAVAAAVLGFALGYLIANRGD